MIIGNKARFAIESGITKAYSNPGLRALGYFTLHIAGLSYGVRAPDATMLACSFDKVNDRLMRKGLHKAPFVSESAAGKIADAYRDAVFAPDQEDQTFFGMPHPKFRDLIYKNQLVWAPDGDQAFDDWSHVLQFDDNDRVRLIGFKCNEVGYHHKHGSLSDLWIQSEEFYEILSKWSDEFENAWTLASKVTLTPEGV